MKVSSSNNRCVAGAILTGGLSSRMGADKANLRPGGINAPTLLDLAFRKLACVTPHIFVSCAKGQIRAGYQCIEDSIERCGPFGGVLSLLRALRNYSAVLVLGCDMPLLPPDILTRLMEKWEQVSEEIMFAGWKSSLTGKIQMLSAIYGRKSLPFFEKAARAGHHMLWNVVPERYRLVLTYEPELEPFFRSCNTPAELACINWQELCN